MANGTGAGLSATRQWLKSQRVAVLKGGWSRERPISLKTGAAVEASFRRLGVPVGTIDVKRDVLDQLRRHRVSFAFLALHGAFGEDGRIQSALELLGIGYTGCGPVPSALAMDKVASKRHFAAARVPTPDWILGTRADFEKSPSGLITKVDRWRRGRTVFVKPYDQGSAIGVNRVARRSELANALRACFRISSGALVERFIGGRELTVGIVGDQALPVIEIVPAHSFYDFHSKYAKGGSRHLVPAPLTGRVTRQVQEASRAAFRAIGGEVYGRVDVILDRSGRPWVLEVNTIPGMTATSLLPDAARSAGLSFDELVLRIVDESRRARPSAGRR